MYADEKYLPYYRPYLSKAFSKEYDKVPDQQALRSKEFYKNNQIEFYSGKSVRLVNDKDHTVTLSDGTTVKYDKVTRLILLNFRSWLLLAIFLLDYLYPRTKIMITFSPSEP